MKKMILTALAVFLVALFVAGFYAGQPTNKTRSETFMPACEMKWEKAGEGIQRQILAYDPHMMVVRAMFETGAVGTMHTHYHSQATYVLSGKFEATVDGEKKVLTEGDCVYNEPDILHGITCIEKGVILDIFTPVRADFLK